MGDFFGANPSYLEDAARLIERLIAALELREAADPDSPAWVAEREIRQIEHQIAVEWQAHRHTDLLRPIMDEARRESALMSATIDLTEVPASRVDAFDPRLVSTSRDHPVGYR